MQLDKVLHNVVGMSLEKAGIRSTKIDAILDMTNSLFNKSQLTLTSIGRHLLGEADVKHKIKRVDRWLGNEGLQKEIPNIYKAIFQDLLANRKNIEILVDWSGCCNQTECTLRASLAYSGRSITIYQEVHTTKEQQKESIHRKFLNNLKNIIPKECNVIIITDRGFGCSWFDMVIHMGWDFIGRIPGYTHYQLKNSKEWHPIKNLYDNCSNIAECFGIALLGKSNSKDLEVTLHGYKEPAKNRKAKRTRNKPLYAHLNKQYREMNTTPWVLATSLDIKENANKIVENYADRMQIEQNFRDDKNERWGFAMQFSRTKTPKRLNVLLMLVAIASYVLLLIGVASESMNLHRKFQANTIRHRRVLSLIMLGKQVMMHLGNLLKFQNITEAIEKVARGEVTVFVN